MHTFLHYDFQDSVPKVSKTSSSLIKLHKITSATFFWHRVCTLATEHQHAMHMEPGISITSTKYRWQFSGINHVSQSSKCFGNNIHVQTADTSSNDNGCISQLKQTHWNSFTSQICNASVLLSSRSSRSFFSLSLPLATRFAAKCKYPT